MFVFVKIEDATNGGHDLDDSNCDVGNVAWNHLVPVVYCCMSRAYLSYCRP